MLIPKIEQRIHQCLRFLKGRRYRELTRLEFEIFETGDTYRAPPEGVDWKAVTGAAEYGKPWQCAWFRAAFTAPGAGDHPYPVYLRAEPNADSLVFIDGVPAGAFNMRHRKLKVPCDGRRHTLHIEAYAGHPYPGCHSFDGEQTVVTIGRQISGMNVFGGGALVERVEPVYGLYYDALCLIDLAGTLDAVSLRKARILRGLHEALMSVHYSSTGKVLEEEAAAARRVLAPLLQAENGSTTPEIHLIGHAHIDHAWLWHIGETERKAARTYINMTRLIEEYPEFIFIQTQPAQLEGVRNNYPAVFEAVKTAYERGNWEPNGGMWVEADCNITGGESLVRQFLVGKAVTRELLGYEGDTLWLPDVFGYAAALPQILAGCGIRYFVTSKIGWNDTTHFPYDTFIWRGVDGTGIRTHFISKSQGYNGQVRPKALADCWKDVQHREIQSGCVQSIGEGDGGGGTARGDLEMARRLRNLEGAPKAAWRTVSSALDRIFGPEGAEPWPEWRGELYLELHRGTYTTQARTKRWNRKNEFALRHVELMSAFAALETGDAGVYPREALLRDWKTVLTLQFHDIIPGSSIRRVYDEAEADHQAVAADLAGLAAAARRRLLGAGAATTAGAAATAGAGTAGATATAGSARAGAGAAAAAHGSARAGAPAASKTLAVFNDLSWERRGPVSLPAAVLDEVGGGAGSAAAVAGGGSAALTAPGAAPIPVQRYRDVYGEDQAVFAAPLPGMGWATFALAPGSADADGVGEKFVYTGETLETPVYLVGFDEAGRIRSLVDKATEIEVVATGGAFNGFVTAQDIPVYWEAWDVDADWTRYISQETRLRSTEVVSQGSVCFVLRRTYDIGAASTLTQDVVFYAGSRRVDFVTAVDWRERQRLLKVEFDTAIDATEARCEVQYGHILRNTHRNLPEDRAKFEICAHKWVSLEEAGGGVALLNDCKYGHDVSGGTLRLTLLRSPLAPDPEADQGAQRFTYALYPFAGPFAASGVVREAYEINAPAAAEAATVEPGLSNSLFAVDGEAVIAESVKAPESGGAAAVVLRLYETLGGRARTTLRFARAPSRVEATDMLERDPRPLAFSGREVPLEFRAFEIKTVMVTF